MPYTGFTAFKRRTPSFRTLTNPVISGSRRGLTWRISCSKISGLMVMKMKRMISNWSDLYYNNVSVYIKNKNIKINVQYIINAFVSMALFKYCLAKMHLSI